MPEPGLIVKIRSETIACPLSVTAKTFSESDSITAKHAVDSSSVKKRTKNFFITINSKDNVI